MWGTGWQNIMAMSVDMPYWESDEDGKDKGKEKEKELTTGEEVASFLNS